MTRCVSEALTQITRCYLLTRFLSNSTFIFPPVTALLPAKKEPEKIGFAGLYIWDDPDSPRFPFIHHLLSAPTVGPLNLPESSGCRAARSHRTINARKQTQVNIEWREAGCFHRSGETQRVKLCFKTPERRQVETKPIRVKGSDINSNSVTWVRIQNDFRLISSDFSKNNLKMFSKYQ